MLHIRMQLISLSIVSRPKIPIKDFGDGIRVRIEISESVNLT